MTKEEIVFDLARQADSLIEVGDFDRAKTVLAQVKSALEDWRKELALVDPFQLDECDRTEFYAATAKLHIQIAINDQKTQKLIEKEASHDRLPPRREESTEEYVARLRKALGGKYFG